MSLGGKPRKLDIEKEDEEKSRDAKSALKDVNTVDSSTVSAANNGAGFSRQKQNISCSYIEN